MQDISSNRSFFPSNGNGNGNSNGNGNGKNGTSYLYSPPVVKQPNLEEDEESLDIRQLLNVFKHRFRLISAITLGLTASITIWTLNQKPKYRGGFQVLVEPVNKEQQETKLNFLGQNLDGIDYKSQIEVLRSPSVLNPIIQKLQQSYPEIEYGELITDKKPPLKIEQVEETKILEISYEDHDPKKIQFVLANLAEAYLDYSLEQKRVEITQGIYFVDNQLPGLQARVDELQEKLQKFRQKYNLLDPEEQSALLSQQLTQQQEQFFETQVQIKEARSLYHNLQQQLGLEPEQAIAASYLSESPRYQNLLDQLQEVEVSLANESARFVETSPNMINLKERKEELLPLLEQEAARVLGRNFSGVVVDSPSLASPSTLRLELNQQYVEAANRLQVLELRRQSLQEGISALNSLTRQMPVIARQYTDLTRELSVANESLNRFLAAEEKLELEAAQQSIPWQIIAKPTIEEDQIFPKPPRDIALGLIGGTLLGLASALLAERLDPVFHSTDELKEMSKLAILGTIPLQKDLEPIEISSEAETTEGKETPVGLPQLQIGNNPINVEASSNQRHRRNWYHSSPFLEAFRSLNTNIRLLGSDSFINSIVVSSSIPSEGKSTVSSHLAQAAAAMGQKVLLIDADLRRPQVHRWMGIQNTEGLSNILATNLSIEAAIKKIPQWENLSVITAGDIPPDPTRLLSSQKMQELMNKLKGSHQYDLIIYDTPPILGFADGRILAARTNGVVLVVKMGKTDRSLLKQNIDNLKMSNVSILGLVANQVNRHSSGSSYYYSHYYADRK